MTCANVILTVAAIAAFLFGTWPRFGSPVLSAWIVGIASVLVIVVAWTGVGCKWCVKKGRK